VVWEVRAARGSPIPIGRVWGDMLKIVSENLWSAISEKARHA